MGSRLDGWSLFAGRHTIFIFSIAFRPLVGSTQPHFQWVPGAVSPAVKRQNCEADHSPPSTEEVKNGGATPPLPHTSSRRDN
jgi:hypothetical protein